MPAGKVASSFDEYHDSLVAPQVWASLVTWPQPKTRGRVTRLGQSKLPRNTPQSRIRWTKPQHPVSSTLIQNFGWLNPKRVWRTTKPANQGRTLVLEEITTHPSEISGFDVQTSPELMIAYTVYKPVISTRLSQRTRLSYVITYTVSHKLSWLYRGICWSYLYL